MTNYVINYESDVKCQSARRALPGPEQPVPRIPQPRQDVAVLVQLAVERGGEDRHVGVVLEHVARALGRRHEIDDTQELNYRAIARAIADTNFAGFVAHEFVPTRDPLTSLGEAVRICEV